MLALPVNWASASGNWSLNNQSTVNVDQAPGDGMDSLAMNAGSFLRGTMPLIVKGNSSITNAQIGNGVTPTPIQFNAALDFAGAGNTRLYANVTALGPVGWRGSAGDLDLAGGSLSIASGQTFSIEGNRSLVSGTITNRGTIRKNAGGGLTRLNQSNGLNVSALNNSGSVTVSSGQLKLEGGGTHTGTFSSTSVGDLFFSGGINQMNSGSSISGRPIRIENSGTAVSFGAGSNPLGAQLIVQNGAVLNINTSPAGALQNTVVDNAAFGGTSTVGVNALTLTNGSIGGSGILFANGTSSFTQTAGNFTTWGKPVIVGGTLNLNGTGDIIMLPGNGGSLGCSFGAVINFNSSKTVREPTISCSSTSSLNVLNNSNVVLGEPAGTAGSVQLSGAINITSGTLTLNVGGNHTGTFSNSGVLRFAKGSHSIDNAQMFGGEYWSQGGANVSLTGATNIANTAWYVSAGTLRFVNTLGQLGSLVTGFGATVTLSQPLTVSDPVTLGDTTINTSGPGSMTLSTGGNVTGALTLAAPMTTLANMYQVGDVSISNSGALNVGPAATWTLSGTASISGAGPVNVQGTLDKSVAGLFASVVQNANVTGTVRSSSGGLALVNLANLSGSTLTGGTYVASDGGTIQLNSLQTNRATLVQSGLGGIVPFNTLAQNEGTIVLQNGKYALQSVDLSNSSLVNIESGTLDLASNSRSYTQTAGTTSVRGTLTAASLKLFGGQLIGVGDVVASSASFSGSKGRIRPGADGNASTGRLRILGPTNFAQGVGEFGLNSFDGDNDVLEVGTGVSIKDFSMYPFPMEGFDAPAGTKWGLVQGAGTIASKPLLNRINTHFLEVLDAGSTKGVRLIRPAKFALMRFKVEPEQFLVRYGSSFETVQA